MPDNIILHHHHHLTSFITDRLNAINVSGIDPDPICQYMNTCHSTLNNTHEAEHEANSNPGLVNAPKDNGEEPDPPYGTCADFLNTIGGRCPDPYGLSTNCKVSGICPLGGCTLENTCICPDRLKKDGKCPPLILEKNEVEEEDANEDNRKTFVDDNLWACDDLGTEIETGGGKSGSLKTGKYCTDPYGRGYNVCVSVLPYDFAEKTNGFCYNSTLNNAASSQWFIENNGPYRANKPDFSNHGGKNKEDMIPKRLSPLKIGLADVYEVKNREDGSWWPVTLTGVRGDVGTYEGMVFDRNLRPDQLSGEIDGSEIRSYSDQDWGKGDIVMLSKKGLTSWLGGDKMGVSAGELGTITDYNAKTGRVTVIDSSNDGSKPGRVYFKNQLTHAGLRSDQIPRLKNVMIGGEYMRKSEIDNEERVVTVVEKNSNNGNSLIVEEYNAKTEKWRRITNVRSNELRLLPGIDRGRTINVCKKHTGRPMCVTSKAFQRYANDDKDPSRSAIELNCKATVDRRNVSESGGTNCNKYLRRQKPHTHFRISGNTAWNEDGIVDWIWGVKNPNINKGEPLWLKDTGKHCKFL